MTSPSRPAFPADRSRRDGGSRHHDHGGLRRARGRCDRVGEGRGGDAADPFRCGLRQRFDHPRSDRGVAIERAQLPRARQARTRRAATRPPPIAIARSSRCWARPPPTSAVARFTVDGGSVTAVALGGSQMGFSQEVVQEFQVSTVNFDLAAGMTDAGSINVVTRGGGNQPRGHHLLFLPRPQPGGLSGAHPRSRTIRIRSSSGSSSASRPAARSAAIASSTSAAGSATINARWSARRCWCRTSPT